ncbi:MAG: DUF6449 domain-containing protein, partial [Bacillota bacterium]|nr:DUF6449 domain-containing protein [Bacillota bacterium]
VISRIVEVILTFDIKAIKSHWLGLIVSLVVTGCIVSCFAFDLTDYDEYVPAVGEVESVNIEINGVNMYGEGYSNIAEDERDYYGYGSYYSYYPLTKRTAIADEDNINAAIAIAKNGIENLPKADEAEAAARDEAGIVSVAPYGNGASSEPETTAVIKYNLKNGRAVVRTYGYVSKKDTAEAVKTIVSSAEFKENQLEYLERKDLTVGDFCYTDTGFIVSGDMIGKSNYRKFLELYREDAMDLTMADMTGGRVVASVNFYEDVYPYGSLGCDITAPVYDCYERTLGFLAELGYSLENCGVLRSEYITLISKETYNTESDAEVEVSEVAPEDYDTVLAETFSDGEFVYNYFLDETSENEDYDTDYFVRGNLSYNSYEISVYRSPGATWE